MRDLVPCVQWSSKTPCGNIQDSFINSEKTYIHSFPLEKKNLVISTNIELLLCHEEIVSSLLACLS